MRRFITIVGVVCFLAFVIACGVGNRKSTPTGEVTWKELGEANPDKLLETREQFHGRPFSPKGTVVYESTMSKPEGKGAFYTDTKGKPVMAIRVDGRKHLVMGTFSTSGRDAIALLEQGQEVHFEGKIQHVMKEKDGLFITMEDCTLVAK